MERIELVVNGEIVAQADASDPSRARLRHALKVDSSCWVAMRALGPRSPMVLGGPVFAHTSPVYISVGGAPIVDVAAASYFVEWIERLISMCREQGRYASPLELEEIVEVFRLAKNYYRDLT